MGLKTAISARLRFAPLVVASAVLSSAVLGLSATGTLAAFTATITNTDSSSTGSLVMKEALTGSSTTCLSSDATTCTINKYGTELLTPAHPTNTTTVTFTNTGRSPISTFVMTPTTCSKGSASTGTGDVCGGITVGVTCVVGGGSPATVVPAGTTLTQFGTHGLYDLGSCLPGENGGTPASFTFTVTLTGTGNEFQNTVANQNLTWKFQNGA